MDDTSIANPTLRPATLHISEDSLPYAGIPFNLKVKVPRQLPPFIAAQDIETLRERLGDKRTHKATSFRDLVLLETACKEVPSKSV